MFAYAGTLHVHSVIANFVAPTYAKSAAEAAELHDVLSSHILFGGASCEALITIVRAMMRRCFCPGDVLIQQVRLGIMLHCSLFLPQTMRHGVSHTPYCTQGDAGDFYYVVTAGAADISIEGRGVVMRAGKGSGFGELALLYDAPRAATVTAVETVST